MYEVKAEKKPVSADRATLSMICDGFCRGMAGMDREGRSVEEKDGLREFTKRLIHMWMI